MRTDVKIIKDFEPVWCIQVPMHSPGRTLHVQRGDFIEWQYSDDGYAFKGRVLALTENGFLVVIMQLLSGTVYERWVKPEWVVNTHRSENTYTDKVKWLYSEEFLQTPLNVARCCGDITYKQIKESITDER